MDSLFKIILANRPRSYGIAVIVTGWLALISGMPDAIPAGMTTILGLLLGTEVHNAVMTTKKAATAITQAAGEAAEHVARDLGSDVVGEPGEMPIEALVVVKNVASEVTSEVLKDVGLTRKDLAT